MIKVCKVCNREYKVNTMGRDLDDRLIQACNIDCLIKFIKNMDKAPELTDGYFINPKVRPFQSTLEEALFYILSNYFEIYYERYILKRPESKSIYVPDFYIKDKNIFIEVKGGKHRITKFKKFAKYYPLYILLPEVVDEVE